MTKREYNQAYYKAHREEMCAAEKIRRKRPGYIEKERARYQLRRVSILAQKKVYNVVHREERAAYYKKYYTANQNKFKAYRQECSVIFRDAIRERNNRYQLNNPEKLKVWRKRWAEKYPEKVRMFAAERKAREVNATINPKATRFFYAVIANQDAVTCTYCGKFISDRKYQIDHIIPLTKNGKHDPDNLCVACPACNLSKNDELLSQWKKCPERIRH